MQASVKKNISVIPAKPAYDRSIRPQMRTLRVAAYCRVSTLITQKRLKVIPIGNWRGFMQMMERVQPVPERDRISSL